MIIIENFGMVWFQLFMEKVLIHQKKNLEWLKIIERRISSLSGKYVSSCKLLSGVVAFVKVVKCVCFYFF